VRESGGSKKCPNGHILAGVEQMLNNINKLQKWQNGKGKLAYPMPQHLCAFILKVICEFSVKYLRKFYHKIICFFCQEAKLLQH
jgi:hypothetical protein